MIDLLTEELIKDLNCVCFIQEKKTALDLAPRGMARTLRNLIAT